MKRLLYLLCFTLLSVIIGACAPAANAPAGSSAAKPASDIPVRTGSMYPQQDLTIIAKTGRPQFVNAYADW
jgi:hypothetical protein